MLKILHLFKKTALEFWEDDGLRMAATLSYYLLFALPPVIMILLSYITLVVPDKAAYLTLIEQVTDIAGPSFAQAIHPYSSQIDSLISQSVTARYTGLLLLILALFAVLGQFKYSLNRIWELTARPGQPFFFHFKQRLFSIVVILVLGAIIGTSFTIHIGINLLAFYASGFVSFPYEAIQTVNALLAFVSVWMLISAIYRFLPDGNMAWRDIFVGGFVTSILFVIGKQLIGIVLSNSILISIYGITGSILILLLWIYYSCIIFFFGAEFTQVYANSHGSGISYDPRFTLSFKPHSEGTTVIN
ncbi:MAG: YihY/virulence factor BrkB family protein [bacterium]|nr:YihY/virulence factor BrkB family protein [bacterium]